MRIQKKWWAVFLALCILTSGCSFKMPAADAGNKASEALESGIDERQKADGETLKESGGERLKESGGETLKGSGEETLKGSGAETEQEDGRPATDREKDRQIDVVQAGMEPVYGSEVKDGVYSVKVESSSSMFRIEECELTVREGVMSAVLSMSGTGYLKVYPGTGKEAVEASEEDYIPYTELADGTHTFEIPVEALNMGINLSAFSKRKEKWYDRVLVFCADSLPADAFADGRIATAESLKLTDGTYKAEVTLDGGSGRASVESPAVVRVENGRAYATVVWGSSNYDYMKVDGVKYELKSKEGNSAFEILVAAFDRKTAVIADTIAMSEPHEIEYTLTFDSSTLKKAE